MGFVIATNVPSITAQSNLTRTNQQLAKSLERLSSGFKINRGADGPAALVISEKNRAQIAGLRTAIANTEKAVSVVQTAEGALNEINGLLVRIRSLALDSANTGASDDDALAANQAEIDNALDTINRIANNTQFGIKKLLDGSAGYSGVVTDADVTFLKATTDTTSTNYAVVVTTVGTRANTTAGTSQTQNLAADELLIINGVSISLNAGLTATQVINRINEFTAQTDVVAEDNGSGATRLRTNAFGSNSEVTVVSNIAEATDSTGFGINSSTVNGTNVIATFNGTSYTGEGNVITAATGAAKGLSISIAADTGSNQHQTVTGAQGNVSVIDNSLQFQIGPNQNQTINVAIQRMNPISLGIGVAGNQF